MLTITALSARGKAASGADVLRYLTESEIEISAAAAYYLGGKESATTLNTSRWLEGAAALGLQATDRVDHTIMHHLSRGFAPDGTTALCQNAGDEGTWTPYTDAQGAPLLDENGQPRGRFVGGHRVGYDLTFSADKTISLAYALADDGERIRILEAHRRAVDAAMAYLARQVETRRGKNGADVQAVAGLIASGHTHFGSRDLDPQIHEHVLVYNVAQGADGSWASFDPEMLYRHQRTAGALYRAQMAVEMQRLGYGVRVEVERDAHGEPTGEVWTRVQGLDPALAEVFSSRRAAIEARMAATGETAQEATLATRAKKEEPPYPDLLAMWKTALDEMRRDGEVPVPENAQALLNQPDALRTVADADLLREVQDGTAILTRAAVLERVALAQAGRMDAAGIEREADRLLDSPLLVEVEPERQPADAPEGTPSHRYTDRRWVMREHLAQEDAVLAFASQAADSRAQRVESARVDAALERVQREDNRVLSAEQQAAVRHLTSESGQLAVLVGRAGTGKTTSMRAAARAWEADGCHLIGASIGWDAARKLGEEAGIESHSVAALLHNDRLRLTPKTILLVDEAGMVDTRQLHALVERVQASGSKLVLVGDEHQLQAVGAGGLFGQIARAHGHATLTEIRRQEHAQDRATATAFYAHADAEDRAQARIVSGPRMAKAHGLDLLDRLHARGQVHAHETRADAMMAMVRAYRADAAPEHAKTLLAGTRAEVALLNQAVRAEKQQAGELQGSTARLTVDDRGVLGTVDVQVGDQVRFTRRDQERQLVNGDRGRVLAITAQAITVGVEGENGTLGRNIVLDRRNTQHLVHGYASTVHRAQGQTKTAVWHLADGRMDGQSSLVAFTRASARYALHGADLDLERIASKLGADRRAWSAREAGIVEPVAAPRARGIERDRSISR